MTREFRALVQIGVPEFNTTHKGLYYSLVQPLSLLAFTQILGRAFGKGQTVHIVQVWNILNEVGKSTYGFSEETRQRHHTINKSKVRLYTIILHRPTCPAPQCYRAIRTRSITPQNKQDHHYRAKPLQISYVPSKHSQQTVCNLSVPISKGRALLIRYIKVRRNIERYSMKVP